MRRLPVLALVAGCRRVSRRRHVVRTSTVGDGGLPEVQNKGGGHGEIGFHLAKTWLTRT